MAPIRRRRAMVRVIERVAEHYDVQEVVEFGRVYRWCPESVVVECKCGKKSTVKKKDLLLGTVNACDCGEDQTAGIRGEVQEDEEVVGHLLDEDDEAVHPWRYWSTSEATGIPF